MLRRALILTACLTAPSLAAPSEPSSAQIRHIAETCTTQGAFGVSFNEKFSGHSPRAAAAEWAPFQILFVRPNVESGQVLEVGAMASFEKALMSNEDRVALANWVFHALDAEIQSTHRFVRRDAHPNGVTYHSAPGFTLDLSHEGVVVHMDCTSERRPARETAQ